MATEARPPAMVVGVDDSEHSAYALQWTLRHFFSASSNTPVPFKLVVVHSKPIATSVIGLAGPGAADVLPFVDSDLRKIAARVIDRAKELCVASSVPEVEYEIVEGDPRNVLCEAVERHQADMLVVGSHGYGGCAGQRERLLRSSCALHSDDSEEAQAKALIDQVWMINLVQVVPNSLRLQL